MYKELIVVEGKNDANAIRRALGDVDIIWTEGFGLSKQKLDYIAEAAKNRGVIVVTDPDSIGEQIRKKIMKKVPESKHVYLSKKAAKKGQDIGIENVSPDEIRRAFEHIVQQEEKQEELLTINDVVQAGLVGKPGSADRRSALGRTLGIGETNAKQFLIRINRFGIKPEDFWKAVEELDD